MPTRTHNEYSQTLQAEILIRALGIEGFKDLMDQYRQACHASFYSTPTSNDYKIAVGYKKFRKEGLVSREIAKKLGIKDGKLESIVRRVARYEYMNAK